MLESLGPSADTVAAVLEASGIRGMPNTVGSLNPLVKYAATQLQMDAMFVDMLKGTHLTVTFRDWRQEYIDVPAAVREFLMRFNRGEYPQLLMMPTG